MARYSPKGLVLSVSNHPEVYPPGDDTFLLIDALEVGQNTVLEVGTGSGIVAIYCASRGARVTCTDINPYAVALARQNAASNGVDIAVVEADMFEGIRGRFEIVIFNPPYLPTSSDDITGDRWLDASINGGPDGLEPARRFLDGLACHLEPPGRAYLITSSLSCSELLPPEGLRVRQLASRKLEFELLTVNEVSLEARS